MDPFQERDGSKKGHLMDNQEAVVNLGSKVQGDLENFPELFHVLKQKGYEVVGPKIVDGAIVYEPLEESSDLPVGCKDEQEAGRYRLNKRDDNAFFGYAVGPQSWKKYLFPPQTKLWEAQRKENTFELLPTNDSLPKYALLGVRPCELSAIAIQDKVFMGGAYGDTYYQARRDQTILIGVNCIQPAATCFCTSLNTGPRAQTGFDILIRENPDQNRHIFILEAGTNKGKENGKSRWYVAY